MEIYLSNSSGVPIYAQITDQIRAKIFAGELKEGEQLEIQVAGHWIEVELERDPDGGWSWRDLESGWVLRRTNAAPIGVRKDNA